MRTIQIGELFTHEELVEGKKIFMSYKDKSFVELKTVLRDQIVAQAMPRINQTTGQENDLDYMAHVLCYAFFQASE